jgi:hypothetical protein
MKPSHTYFRDLTHFGLQNKGTFVRNGFLNHLEDQALLRLQRSNSKDFT